MGLGVFVPPHTAGAEVAHQGALWGLDLGTVSLYAGSAACVLERGGPQGQKYLFQHSSRKIS